MPGRPPPSATASAAPRRTALSSPQARRNPSRLWRLTARAATPGGRGRHRGGDGVIREVECREPAQVWIVSDRRKKGPYGRPAGKPGRNTLNGRSLPGKINFRVKAGDRVRIETPGGGGV